MPPRTPTAEKVGSFIDRYVSAMSLPPLPLTLWLLDRQVPLLGPG